MRGRGYLLGLRFGLNRHNGGDGLLGYLGEQEALTALVVSHLLHVEGVRVGYTLNQGGVLRIEPPLTATWDDCQFFLQAFERVLQRIERRNLAALTSQVTGFSATVEIHRPRVEARPHRTEPRLIRHLLHRVVRYRGTDPTSFRLARSLRNNFIGKLATQFFQPGLRLLR